jgi:uncharacterized protein (TIGR02217 family)
MDFLETPRLDIRPSYGFRSIPRFKTKKVEMDSGDEVRNRSWTYPLHRFEVSVDSRHQNDVYDIREHFMSVGGDAIGFRLSDPTDYKSCRPTASVSALDAPLIASGGSYQLVKRYTKGALTQDRLILKPVAGSILVANHLGVVQASSRWSLDATTGLLTPNGDFVGTPATWGGEFDVPVRFNGDELPVSAVEFETESVAYTLMELRNP